jgi:hypothetical protein
MRALLLNSVILVIKGLGGKFGGLEFQSKFPGSSATARTQIKTGSYVSQNFA